MRFYRHKALQFWEKIMTKVTRKHALLVQAHKNLDYFIQLANDEKNLNVYVHLDKKSAEFECLKNQDLPSNFYILEDSISVIWGGFSQVLATLKLFHRAMLDSENQFFHLVSGEDVVLQPFEMIEKNWQDVYHFAPMLICEQNSNYFYRFFCDTLHANTRWQRSLGGKILTKIQQIFAKTYLLFTKPQPVYFGSQWFSITRDDWQKIQPFLQKYQPFFAKKLVPDEHFFQTLLKNETQIQPSNVNQRYIIFDKKINNGNSPIYLDFAQLQRAKQQYHWFARKVHQDVANEWLNKEHV